MVTNVLNAENVLKINMEQELPEKSPSESVESNGEIHLRFLLALKITTVVL